MVIYWGARCGGGRLQQVAQPFPGTVSARSVISVQNILERAIQQSKIPQTNLWSVISSRVVWVLDVGSHGLVSQLQVTTARPPLAAPK